MNITESLLSHNDLKIHLIYDITNLSKSKTPWCNYRLTENRISLRGARLWCICCIELFAHRTVSDIPVTETETDTEMTDFNKTHTETNTEKIFNMLILYRNRNDHEKTLLKL